jgi:hypothetical protein
MDQGVELQLSRFGRFQEFWAVASEFLYRREADHSIILGLLRPLMQDEQFYGQDVHFGVISSRSRNPNPVGEQAPEGGSDRVELHLAYLWVPPRPFFVSCYAPDQRGTDLGNADKLRDAVVAVLAEEISRLREERRARPELHPLKELSGEGRDIINPLKAHPLMESRMKLKLSIQFYVATIQSLRPPRLDVFPLTPDSAPLHLADPRALAKAFPELVSGPLAEISGSGEGIEHSPQLNVVWFSATEHTELVRGWFAAFILDVFHEPAEPKLFNEIMGSLSQPDLSSPCGGPLRRMALLYLRYQRNDGQVVSEPVSMACCQARTRNTMRLANVYTPPEWRGKGFGQLLTWWLTAWLLAPAEAQGGGCSAAVIAADKANATSNGIYQRIGFEATIDEEQYEMI